MQQLCTRADHDKLPRGLPGPAHRRIPVQGARPHLRSEARVLAGLAELLGPDRALPSPTDVGLDGRKAAHGDTTLESRTLPGFSLTPTTHFTPAGGT